MIGKLYHVTKKSKIRIKLNTFYLKSLQGMQGTAAPEMQD